MRAAPTETCWNRSRLLIFQRFHPLSAFSNYLTLRKQVSYKKEGYPANQSAATKQTQDDDMPNTLKYSLNNRVSMQTLAQAEQISNNK